MAFKIVIGEKGKAWKIDLDSEILVGKSIGEKVEGKELMNELQGYEFEITGGSDMAGFPLSKDVPGLGLKAILLKKGWGMRDNTEGIRRRKTVRGKVISNAVSQINLKILKHGNKKLEEIFPDQNKPKLKKEGKKVEVATVV